MESRAKPVVRPYRVEDRGAVVQMLADSDPWKRLGYTAADWERLFASPPADREAFVIEMDGAVAGIALLRPKVLLGDYLELLAVAPGARGNGLGSTLLRHVEMQVFLRSKNFYACVSDFNHQARRFYARHGFQEIGPIPNLLIHGSAEILMRKTMGPAQKS